MSAFPELKAYSNDSGSFSETTDFKVLCCGKIDTNNNKYYVLEVQKDPNSGYYRLFCTRGRIGSSPVYGVREELGGSKITDYSTIKREYEKIVDSKTKGKSSSKSEYTIVETHKPSVGSSNICGKSIGEVKTKLDFFGHINAMSLDDESKRILKQAYAENIHSIQTTTTINITSSGLETALGPLTPTYISEAREILRSIQVLMSPKMASDSRVITLNNKYLSMVPRDMGRKITQEDMIITDKKLIEEFDLLDQLESALQVINTSNSDDAEFKLGFSISHNPSILSDVSKNFETTRASNHGNLKKWKVKNAFDICVDKDRSRFDKCTFDNIVRLWHGSRNCNIMSILLNGLIIPPHNAAGVTGRMFGNGVYAASNSTKALNYSVGYWSNTRNKYPNSFLFVVDFKMGNIHYPKHSFSGLPPNGYTSTHAKVSNTGLYNDEYIVYDLKQQTICNLIELEER